MCVRVCVRALYTRSRVHQKLPMRCANRNQETVSHETRMDGWMQPVGYEMLASLKWLSLLDAPSLSSG